jgi:alkaline phosphatase
MHRRLAALIGAAALAVLLGSSVLVGRGEAEDGSTRTKGGAKNVIFMMGDGMGPAHRDAIQLATVGAYDRLATDRLPVEGMVGTNSADPETFVTDSAAAATSLATGVKTYNGAIGVDAEGREVRNIVEQAKAAGKSVGLVTTSQVTDASPAGFAAHVEDRSKQSVIARKYIEDAKVDVILGGGEDRWYPAGNPGAFPDNPPEDPSEQSIGTEGNLVNRAKNLGYQYVTSEEGLESTNGKKVLGLFANEKMFQQRHEGQGAVYNPRVPLPVITREAIRLLSRDPQGFFLFVEGEAIDEMSHSNNAPLTIKSGQKLDRSVTVAGRFADKDMKTLQIVTADHECGGLTVEEFSNSDESGGEIAGHISNEDGPFSVANSDYQSFMDWTTTGHTGVDVPLTAKGPGFGRLTGNYENTSVYHAMAGALGVTRR